MELKRELCAVCGGNSIIRCEGGKFQIFCGTHDVKAEEGTPWHENLDEAIIEWNVANYHEDFSDCV